MTGLVERFFNRLKSVESSRIVQVGCAEISSNSLTPVSMYFFSAVLKTVGVVSS